MTYFLESITQTVCEIVRGIYLPLIMSSWMPILFENPVCCKIPHLRITFIGIINFLLHSKMCFSSFVFTILHGTEFGKRFIDWPITMFTSKTRPSIIWASTLKIDFFFRAVTDVCFVFLYQFLGEVIQL